MMADFCRDAFDVDGDVSVTLADGQVYCINNPIDAWDWLKRADWSSVTVYDQRFDQVYGWDR